MWSQETSPHGCGWHRAVNKWQVVWCLNVWCHILHDQEEEKYLYQPTVYDADALTAELRHLKILPPLISVSKIKAIQKDLLLLDSRLESLQKCWKITSGTGNLLRFWEGFCSNPNVSICLNQLEAVLTFWQSMMLNLLPPCWPQTLLESCCAAVQTNTCHQSPTKPWTMSWFTFQPHGFRIFVSTVLISMQEYVIMPSISWSRKRLLELSSWPILPWHLTTKKLNSV